jgi:hypothetical protein
VLLTLVLGCLEPFPYDRHDLVDLRIVGMRAEGGALAGAQAFAWEGTEGWSATAPAQAWGQPEPGLLTLTITGAEGSSERGVLSVEPEHAGPTLDAWSRSVSSEGAELAVALSGSATVHWMAPGGTLVETGPASTLWLAENVDGVAVDAGIWPVVALWFDGEGGNGWATFDVPVETTGPYLAQAGRLWPLPAGTPEGEAALMATLAEDAGVSGITLLSPANDDGSETAASICGSVAGDWSGSDLLERRCGRNETVGARVRLRGTVVP